MSRAISARRLAGNASVPGGRVVATVVSTLEVVLATVARVGATVVDGDP
jgi:hypothetical protein